MNFYTRLPSFSNYADLMSFNNYQTVPQDWIVIITDIKGSTEAVRQGRYRDVNMVGSMPIASLLNKIDEEIPFVFGGDGATLLIPEKYQEQAKEELRHCMFLARTQYNLTLRAGLVPVKDVMSKTLEVAKYELSPGNFIAQFRGGGLEVAEKLVKQKDYKYLLMEEEGYPTLDGLTCRWSPLKSNRGKILTLIIKSERNSYEVFEKVLNQISVLTNRNLKESSPVTPKKLTASWPPPISLETKTLVKGGSYWKIFTKTAITNFIVYCFIKFNLNTKNFSMETYKKEIAQNSDFKKFDDVLRLVLDCSDSEVAYISSFLDDLETKGEILYGRHLSKQAVMTCLVFSTDQDHIHFIDGSEGGYTLAASILKKKLKNKLATSVAA